MSANVYVIEDYENETAFRPQKNKPKTNPILSAVGGFRKAKMNKKSLAGKSGHNPFDFQSIKRYDGCRLAHIIAAVSL